jgi:mono/diheme cytochrome c family protein
MSTKENAMSKRPQFILQLLVAVTAGALLAACAAPAAPPTATTAPTVAPTAAPTTAAGATAQVARPSNAGGPGPAIQLTGDAKAGGDVFVANCKKCHGDQGQGGVKNPGSDDGTVPPLNPIDESLKSSDPVVYATNLDLFVEHGSTPSGSSPQYTMPAWGDDKKLSPQQIADVIAYVISLNGK